MRRPQRNRLFPLLALTLIAAVGVGYTLYWFHVAGNLRKGIGAFADMRRAQGWEMSYGTLDVGGFPLRVTVTASEPMVKRPDGWSWRGAPLTATLAVYHPTQARIAAPGRHEVTAAGMPPATLTAAAADGLVEFDLAGHVVGGTLAMTGIDATTGGAPVRLDGVQASGRILDIADPDYTTPTFEFALDAQGIDLPPAPELVLGRKLAALALHGRVMGVIAPGPLPEALAEWRDDGGTIELDRIAVMWEPLRLEATGTMALDAQLQPEAALSGTIKGFDETLDAMAGSGVIHPREAAIAKLVLGLMAQPKDGTKTLTVPLTVQEGQLYAGPVTLMRLPRIAWKIP